MSEEDEGEMEEMAMGWDPELDQPKKPSQEQMNPLSPEAEWEIGTPDIEIGEDIAALTLTGFGLGRSLLMNEDGMTQVHTLIIDFLAPHDGNLEDVRLAFVFNDDLLDKMAMVIETARRQRGGGGADQSNGAEEAT